MAGDVGRQEGRYVGRRAAGQRGRQASSRCIHLQTAVLLHANRKFDGERCRAGGAAVAGANQHKIEEMDVDSGTPAASRKEPATKVRPA